MSTHQYTSRPYDEARDRAEYRRWSKAHGVQDIPADFLVPSGAVVEDEAGKPCAMGWVMIDESRRWTFPAFQTTNPDLGCIESMAALEYLMTYLYSRAKVAGALMIHAQMPENMKPFMESIGYTPNHLVWGFFKAIPENWNTSNPNN